MNSISGSAIGNTVQNILIGVLSVIIIIAIVYVVTLVFNKIRYALRKLDLKEGIVPPIKLNEPTTSAYGCAFYDAKQKYRGCISLLSNPVSFITDGGKRINSPIDIVGILSKYTKKYNIDRLNITDLIIVTGTTRGGKLKAQYIFNLFMNENQQIGYQGRNCQKAHGVLLSVGMGD